MKKFSNTTLSMELSSIKLFELMAKGKPDVISLAQGIPSFNTATHIKEAAKKAIDDNLVGKYTPSYGIEPLREAISQKVKINNNIDVAPSEVLVTHGASEALFAIFLALLDPSDEIIELTPGYALHLTQIKIALGGKKAVQVTLAQTSTGWQLDLKALEKAITVKTKAIVLCNPTNPIGKVYSKEELRELAQIAVKHDLYIITDEIYEHFVYDGKKHISIGSFKEVADRTISVFGVSKSYAMTGWRIGYIVAKQNLIDQIFKIHDSIITCPAVVSQYAALAAIEGPQTIVEEYKKAFIKRRQIVIDTISQTDKLSLIKPEGTYYAFAKITKEVDDHKLCLELLEKAKVAVIPGSAFGIGGENHIRISFGLEEDMLRQGLQRLVNYLNFH